MIAMLIEWPCDTNAGPQCCMRLGIAWVSMLDMKKITPHNKFKKWSGGSNV